VYSLLIFIFLWTFMSEINLDDDDDDDD